MSFDKAKKYLSGLGLGDRIHVFETSSATVELAAAALHCEPERIAKSLTFACGERCIMVVAAGDARVDNRKYKDRFGRKPTMLAREETEARVGYAAGGVCPFGVNDGVEVYLDVSLRRFETVFPAVGSSNSAAELTVTELEQAAKPLDWVDVCRIPGQAEQI